MDGGGLPVPPPCRPFWADCLIKEKTEVVYVNSCRTPSNQLLGTAVRHSLQVPHALCIIIVDTFRR